MFNYLWFSKWPLSSDVPRAGTHPHPKRALLHRPRSRLHVPYRQVAVAQLERHGDLAPRLQQRCLHEPLELLRRFERSFGEGEVQLCDFPAGDVARVCDFDRDLVNCGMIWYDNPP